MIDELLKRTIIPVIVIEDADDAVPLAGALLEGGIDVIEVTFRTEAAAQSIELISKAFPSMLLGAGTVLNKGQADRAFDAGAAFALAPGLNPDVIEHYQRLGGTFIPGVMTPSEIEKGMALGCNLLKFFPAGAAGGVSMLQAMAGPYASQGLKFCPTGGVNLENMNDFLALSIVSCIGGSWLATQQQIAEHQWAAITQQCRKALDHQKKPS